MYKRNHKRGFTMVELSLSLVFIAILSIAVVIVMSGAISSYHRSLTLNKVDNVGAGLVRDMKASIQMASANSLSSLCDDNYSRDGSDNDARVDCEADGGMNFASVVRYANVKIKDGKGTEHEVPVFGAFCTGSYSYIWNSGYFFDSNEYEVEDGVEPVSLFYTMNGETDSIKASNFKLLKVKDEARKVCVAAIRYFDDGNLRENTYNVQRTSGNSDGAKISSVIHMNKLASVDEKPTRYLESEKEDGAESEDENDSDSSNLAIYDLTTSVAEQTGITKNAYYYSSFVLGTVHGGVNVDASGNACATPEGYDSAVENLDYCAINKFNFAALAIGG